MAGGRPKTLTSEVKKKARDYINDFESYGHAVPSLVGLCRVINRSRQTLYNWSNDDSEFLDILEAINENQELVTLNKALTGEYNATIAKLLLGKHGYTDRQTLRADVRDVSAMSDAELEAIARG
jgi:hypothetical protein